MKQTRKWNRKYRLASEGEPDLQQYLVSGTLYVLAPFDLLPFCGVSTNCAVRLEKNDFLPNALL